MELKAMLDDEGEEEAEEEEWNKKRGTAPTKPKPTLRRNNLDFEDITDGGGIEMNQHVNSTFSLKYLDNFSKIILTLFSWW